MARQRIIRQQAVAEPRTERTEVVYPEEGDGPMARHPLQFDAMAYAWASLDHHLENRSDVHIRLDMFVYYQEGLPEFRVTPNVFVAIGDFPAPEECYKVWEARVAPQFVLDVLWGPDAVPEVEEKREVYRQLGVEEYWRFDPFGGLLPEAADGARVLGERLMPGGWYAPIPPGSSGWPLSEVVGLEFREEGGLLRVWDSATNRPYLSYAESEKARKAFECQTEEERRRRRASEREFKKHRRDKKRERQLRRAAERRAEEHGSEWRRERQLRKAAERKAEEHGSEWRRERQLRKAAERKAEEHGSEWRRERQLRKAAERKAEEHGSEWRRERQLRKAAERKAEEHGSKRRRARQLRRVTEQCGRSLEAKVAALQALVPDSATVQD